MKNKYYTPKISELHHDFECEFFYNEKWRGGIVQNRNGYFYIMYGNSKGMYELIITEETLESGRIRVKHLDREDVESENWEYNLESSKKLNEKNSNYISIYTSEFKDREGNFYSLFHNTKNNWVLIWTSAGDLSHIIRDDNMQVAGSTVFAGFVLNKSRLKLVMEMLNINQK